MKLGRRGGLERREEEPIGIFFSVGKRRGFSKGNGGMNVPRVQASKGEIEATISPVKNQKATYVLVPLKTCSAKYQSTLTRRYLKPVLSTRVG